jgi:hypothetical protein
VAAEIAATKKQKQKAAPRARLLLVTFLGEARKVTSRRGAPFIGTRSEGAGTVQRVAAINKVVKTVRRWPHPHRGYAHRGAAITPGRIIEAKSVEAGTKIRVSKRQTLLANQLIRPRKRPGPRDV